MMPVVRELSDKCLIRRPQHGAIKFVRKLTGRRYLLTDKYV
jgi:hypothetical protein